MAQAMGLATATARRAVAEAIRDMNARLGLPTGLAALGVTRAMFEQIIDGAMADHCHKTNPRLATRDDYARCSKRRCRSSSRSSSSRSSSRRSRPERRIGSRRFLRAARRRSGGQARAADEPPSARVLRRPGRQVLAPVRLVEPGEHLAAPRDLAPVLDVAEAAAHLLEAAVQQVGVHHVGFAVAADLVACGLPGRRRRPGGRPCRACRESRTAWPSRRAAHWRAAGTSPAGPSGRDGAGGSG